jgi:hypothetical protein
MLTAVRTQAPVTVGRCRCPCWGAPYPAAPAQWRVSSPLPSSFAPLCSSLLLHKCHRAAHRRQPPPSRLCADRSGHKERFNSMHLLYTELLPGALPTEAGQWSSPHRHLPPHELTAECHALSFSSHASTSRRSLATSRPTSATPSPPMTCCLSHRRLPVHHRLLPLVSTSPSDPLDLVHRCTVLPLTTTFPANSPLAGRNRPAEPRR